MTTDFRALCAELLRELEHATHDDYQQALKDRARAALAEPQPEPPTDEELAQTAKQALESYRYNTELPYFLSEDSDEYEPFMLILRAVLARWGNS